MLFNLAGYQLYFHVQERQAAQSLEQKLDAGNYNEADLVQVSIPLSMPYINDDDDFERVDGQITYEGTVYKYVKRKVHHNNLVILCVKDDVATKLSQTKQTYYGQVTDAPSDSKKEAPQKTFKSGITEALPNNTWQYNNTVIACTGNYAPFQNNLVPQLATALPGQPPEAVMCA